MCRQNLWAPISFNYKRFILIVFIMLGSGYLGNHTTMLQFNRIKPSFGFLCYCEQISGLQFVKAA